MQESPSLVRGNLGQEIWGQYMALLFGRAGFVVGEALLLGVDLLGERGHR